MAATGFAVMEERRRLAREIHDTVTQAFAGILLHLEAVPAMVAAGGPSGSDLVERLAGARNLAKSGLEDARRMLLNLRPKSLEEATLWDALRQLAEDFSRECGTACKFVGRGSERDLPAEVQDQLYRVAQEALCNVRKHARATSASISLGCRPGVLILKIKDNGRGIAAMRPQGDGQGYGLSTMRERSQRLGGNMEINSRPGAGTQITIAVPLLGETPMERNNP